MDVERKKVSCFESPTPKRDRLMVRLKCERRKKFQQRGLDEQTSKFVANSKGHHAHLLKG